MDFANNSNINIYNCYFQTIEQNQSIQQSEYIEHPNEKIEMEQIYIPEPEYKVESNLLALTYPNANQTNNSDYMEEVESICSDMSTMVDQELMMDQLGDMFEMFKPFDSENTNNPNTEELKYNYVQHTSCIGCIENQPNQQAHMGPFGCLVSI